MLFVKIVNNEVTQVWDTQPPAGEAGWKSAIEVRPPIDSRTQQYTAHTFDLSKDPVEIVWGVESRPVPTGDALIAQITADVQKRLDDFAGTRNYSSILSACTYANSTNPTFQAEGLYCVGARDATWAKCYEILAEVEAGTRPTPTGYLDIEPELPVLVWP